MPDVAVPALEEKIRAIRRVLPRSPALPLSIIDGEGDFCELLWKVSGLNYTNKKAVERRWQRFRQRDMVPPEIVSGLCVIYPTLTPEILLLPLDQFNWELRERAGAFKRVTDGVAFYLAQRSTIVSWIRSYYREVDVDPDFPMLTRPGWILDEPLLLTPEVDRKMLEWKENVTRPSSVSSIEQTGFRFNELRTHLNPGLKFRKNSSSYRVLEVTVEAGLPKITCSLGNYIDFFDSCEVLGLETSCRYLQVNGGSYGRFKLRPPPRDVFEFSKRMIVVGISTLLILRNHPSGDVFLYHHRGDNVGEEARMLHVVPTSTFEPLSPDDSFHERDFSVRRNVQREFAEELLGKDEFISYEGPGGELFKDTDLARAFNDLFQERKVKLYLLGVGVNPLNTKLSVLTCLVLDLDVLRRRRPGARFTANYEGTIRYGRLTREQLEQLGRHERMSVTGAACMLLGARHLPHLLG